MTGESDEITARLPASEAKCVECGAVARDVHYCGECGKPVCLVCAEAHSAHFHPELAPCPHCDGDPVFEPVVDPDEPDGDGGERVTCEMCGMAGPISDTTQGATREWNELAALRSNLTLAESELADAQRVCADMASKLSPTALKQAPHGLTGCTLHLGSELAEILAQHYSDMVTKHVGATLPKDPDDGAPEWGGRSAFLHLAGIPSRLADAQSALSESRRELDALAETLAELRAECTAAAERLRWGVEEIEKVRAQRDAAVAINVDLGKELDRTLDDLIAARGEIARLTDVVVYAAAAARGIGEHTMTLLADRPQAEGHPAFADPAFVTKCKELTRTLGECIAIAIEKRAALAAKGGA